ncbi:flavodoxin, partial [Faecalibaculum rodentium]
MNDTLVVYFSGNDPTKSATADAARNLASVTGADLYEIRPQNPYSKDFNTVVQEAQRDKDRDARPALAGPSIDVKPYRT